MANGQGTSIASIGSNMFRSPMHPSTILSLKDLLLVPTLTKNLISVSKFAKDNNVYFVFYPHSCFFKSQDLNETLLEGKHGEDGLYHFHPHLAKKKSFNIDIEKNLAFPKSDPCIFLSEKCNHVVSNTYKQWHLRLGHPHHDSLTKALQTCNIRLPTVNKISDFCDSCCIAKSHRLPSQPSTTVYSKPLELVFLDVWVPASLESSCGYLYFLTCVDACTKYMWIYLLRRKSDVYSNFQNFKALAEKQFQTPLKSVQTDGGGEFRTLIPFLQQEGILHRLTCPYMHHQNGTVERRHRHIIELGLAMLHHSALPLKFWDHAFLTATYLINRLPSSSVGFQSPYKLIHNKDPDYAFLKVFGCSCFPLLRPYNQHKIQPRSEECLFLGYSPSHKGYKCLSRSGRIYISKDVIFNEGRFPYNDLFITTTQASIPATSVSILPSLVCSHNPSSSTLISPAITASSGSSESNFLPSSTPVNISTTSPTASSSSNSPPAPPRNDHPMITRSKNGIIQPRINATLLLSNVEPKTVKSALTDPHWLAAMQAEITALHANRTWTLVELPSGRKPIGCRWVFRLKENPDGSINKYKARLVAKGFHQQPGVDFSETFSPVVKPVTIRIVLSLAVTFQTPMIGGQQLAKTGTLFDDPTLYRSVVGALQYAIITRPEIAFSVNKVSQFMCSPMEEHWKVVKRILRYLKGTLKHGLVFTPARSSSSSNLTAFTDADWVADPNDRRSTSATCIYLGPNLVSWWSKKQLLVARSSTEAEYRALAQAVTEVLWIQSLLQELKVRLNTPIVLCDNQSTVVLSHNPVLHSRSKHMELDIFFVREKVISKALVVSHIPAQHQYADLLTKALSPKRFLFLRSKLNVADPSDMLHPP
uniref:Retrovirus-related Pol polyprotein from transposon TNT 1-94 n=1 Tax=Cajanus cajan TaxID=3821 RepID=A0A151S9Q4_CAJCA|nr:Retrovirus-related Pol polyprotein from transposon TNT 1-94 [Cajanus cajan]